MFESITLIDQNSQCNSSPLDIGSLVEAMLLYGKVNVVANYPILEQIYSYFGGDNLLWLLSEGYLNIVYREFTGGIHTVKKNEREIHNVIQFSSPQHCFHDELRKICIDARGRKGAARRLAQKLEKYIRVSRDTPSVMAGTKEFILNSRCIASSARIIINELVPNFELDAKCRFEADQTDQGIEIATDFDFASINKIYHKTTSPDHLTITPAYILAQVLKLEEALFFAASFSSELSCSNLSSRLGINKIDYIIENSMQKSQKLNNFKEAVFGNVNAIREAVNTGSVDLDNIFSVLQKSQQYKDWIRDKDPNSDLLQEYLKKIGEKSFMEKLPGKIIRYSVFAGLGYAASEFLSPTENAAISLSLGALDTFLFDNLSRGWSPNQYINGQLNKIILKQSDVRN